MIVRNNFNNYAMTPAFAGKVTVTEDVQKILRPRITKALKNAIEKRTDDHLATTISMGIEEKTISNPKAVFREHQNITIKEKHLQITDDLGAKQTIPANPSISSGSTGYIEFNKEQLSGLAVKYLLEARKNEANKFLLMTNSNEEILKLQEQIKTELSKK
ncbi:MAG TPA: hypothetical protein P5556_04110 [Candidatus Gastranaerophilales bacterium]|nr:hypothetical protein [Candidatus Gastranaerophilales bacterium]